MRFLSGIGLLLVGCTAFTAPPPFHMMESTELLKQREISITAAVGGGGLVFDGDAFGGGVRLGVGLTDRHSLRLEGTMIGHDTHDKEPEHPWEGRHIDYGWKLSWKYGPRDYFSLIAGFGGSWTPASTALGADVALLFGAPRALGGWFRPYGGVRVGLAGPVASDRGGGVTEEIVIPLGMSATLSENVRLFLEGGFLQAWSQGEKYDNHSGFYGGLALEIRHRN